MATRPTFRQNSAYCSSMSRNARLSVRGSVRPVVANSRARSRKPASWAAANQRPGSPLDIARSKRIFFGSWLGCFFAIARNVARPVDETLAVRAYFASSLFGVGSDEINGAMPTELDPLAKRQCRPTGGVATASSFTVLVFL